MMINNKRELDTDPGPCIVTNNSNSIQHQINVASAQTLGEEPSFNLRLIDIVKQSRCLYDASDRQYRSADYKIKVWNRLVQMLGFQGDARTLYNRWKQLRDKYGKEKKKMRYNNEQPSQWQYFKHLKFLDPHMIDRTQQRYERNKDDKNNQQQIIITDPNFTLHLINEVRLQPCLYDIRDPKYRHTEYRNQAWSEIAKNLSFPGDVNSLYKQWKKIRDRYVREKRKLRMSGGVEQEESNWELYRDLQWIDPYLDERAAQVKRKRESSDISCDELMFMTDAYSSTLNSSCLNLLSDNNDNVGESPLRNLQQMQDFNIQQQTIDHDGQTIGNFQQLIKLQHLSTPIGLQIQQKQHNLARVRPETDTTSIIGTSSLGELATTRTSTANTTLMMSAEQQHIPGINGQLHYQLPQQTTATSHSSATQHVIITNEPPLSATTAIDGDRAFAISVAADLLSLPNNARLMARAQIQHLLENSKITIVKA